MCLSALLPICVHAEGIVPAKNFRIELGSAFASHDINGVPGLEDRRQLAWQGVSVDLRYKLLDRDAAPSV
jgi:hypothetical protein